MYWHSTLFWRFVITITKYIIFIHFYFIVVADISLDIWGHSRLGYYFSDKGIKDYVTLDLGIYYDKLLFDQ